jgi:site-specific recombinase XerD
MTKPIDFAYYLTKYLSDYLPGTVGASPNTIASYKDTFKLFISFIITEKNLKPEKLTLEAVDRVLLTNFLDWIENSRGCSIRTRNIRLTAFHAFFRFIRIREPKHLLKCQEILDIRKKKEAQPMVTFLSKEGVKLLLEQPDPSSPSGIKHQALLTFIYATACRVQEAVDVQIMDFKFNGNNLVKLTGKGAKSRIVPLEPQALRIIERYLIERGKEKWHSPNSPLFLNHSGNKLTRQGITAILKKYADMAGNVRSDLIPSDLTPHSLRHSRAVHWLQSGVDLIYIRDLLGHVSVQTTEVYARIDGEMKRKALEKASSDNYPKGIPVWQSDRSLLEWLKSF